MAGFVVVSDMPMPGDQKRELRDSHGKYFWHLMYNVRVPMKDLAIEFLYHNWREKDAGAHRLSDIMARNKDAKVMVVLGSDALEPFGIEGKTNKVRGSIFKYGKTFVIPTFHTSELKLPYRMFSDSDLQKGFYTAADLTKAVKVYKGGYKHLPERFNVTPTLEDVREFHRMVKAKDPLLGCDLEGTGLSIEHSNIFVHGFAWSMADAICIPERTLHGKPYWNSNEWPIVREILQDIYKNHRLMFQNGVGYDVPLLRARGWEVPLEQFEVDTMVLHHTLSPELPHNIGFISSMYGQQPYWKESFLSRKETIDETDQIEMRIYNCRDCVALYQVYEGMMDEMNELKQEELFSKLPELFEKGMALSRLTIESFEHGILQDTVNMCKWKKFVDGKLEELRNNFYTKHDLPSSFSMNNVGHKLRLVYGILPSNMAYDKLEAELALYDVDVHNYQFECETCGRKVTKRHYETEEIKKRMHIRCPKCGKVQVCSRTSAPRTSVKRKSKSSKTYLELVAKLSVKNITPLYQLHNYKPLKSKKSGKEQLDKGAISRYLNFIDERLSSLDNMKRPRERHKEERVGLLSTRQSLVELQEITKFEKLASSFYDIPRWQDGRVRPFALVTGTATGRWSYKNPAAQTMPHGEIGTMIRSTFRASPGCTLLSVDFSNLEIQIGARFMKDDVLIELLEKGINLHDENTMTFFGLGPDDEGFGTHRPVAKMIQFARLYYGGSDKSIFSKAKTAVPECTLTLRGFKKAVQNYVDAHPAYSEFVEEVQTLAREQRVSVNAFGRVRTLLGEEQAIDRQALNTPIQGSAADAVGEDMLMLDKLFKDNNLKTKMLLQIHDELLFEIPNDELEIACPIIHNVMNREREIKGYKFKIPIDAEIGTHWGLQKPYNLLTQTLIEGRSKH